MQPVVYDAIVIGAGPAGASCAVWLAHLGFSPLILDASEQVGGLTAHNPFEDAWNVTAPGLTGEEVAVQIKRSLDGARVPVLLKMRVDRVEIIDAPDQINALLKKEGKHDKPVCPRLFRVFFDGHSLVSRFVVVASGVTSRFPQELANQKYDHVLVGPGRHISNYEFANKRVAVLGGGDNAFENAIFAQKRGALSVDIYARHIRAQRQWFESLSRKRIHTGEYVFDPLTRTVNGHRYDVVMVFYGWQAQLNGLESLGLSCSEKGYVNTHVHTAETNVSGVYAIGEVANRHHPCIITSMADGVVAAKAIQYRLEQEALELVS
ncbi:MAG: NAD(P)/FAD-dependent oxidoreductase [Alcaligenaceae bacterium]|jgi:thioredoxin reductase|nr:NAD(P)/FAD-dependent oxidoreductase [Alcaligenaceae bacterium]